MATLDLETLRSASVRCVYVGKYRIIETPSHRRVGFVSVDDGMVQMGFDEAVLRATNGERLTPDWF
jgi:hypothetical protein